MRTGVPLRVTAIPSTICVRSSRLPLDLLCVRYPASFSHRRRRRSEYFVQLGQVVVGLGALKHLVRRSATCKSFTLDSSKASPGPSGNLIGIAASPPCFPAPPTPQVANNRPNNPGKETIRLVESRQPRPTVGSPACPRPENDN
jgi:hypothetical protein